MRKQAEDAAAASTLQPLRANCCRENFHHRATMELRVEWVKALLSSASTACTPGQHGALDEFQEEDWKRRAASLVHRFFFIAQSDYI